MASTIIIVDYDPSWPAHFEREASRIRAAFGDLLVDIEHIGSTSVPGLAAKPRIDIMPGLRSEDDLDQTIQPMVALGFRYISEFEDEMPYRRLFAREAGGNLLASNVHIVAVGSEFWERHLIFRDFLREHPEVAEEYARVKRELAPQFTSTPDYAEAKTDFIKSIEAKAFAERDTR